MKTLSSGMKGIYLEIFDAGQRKRESLKLTIYPDPQTKVERKHNEEVMTMAEIIKAKRFLEEQEIASGLMKRRKETEVEFLTYFQKLSNERFNMSSGNYGNWYSVHKVLIRFCEKQKCPNIKLQDIDTSFLLKLKEFMATERLTKSNEKLSQNSIHSYFNKVKAALNQAFTEQLIEHNPASRVKGFKMGETEREYLTMEELQALAETNCSIGVIKQAFIFGCLTGLRWSDIQKLTWFEVRHDNTQGDYIRFRQQKTKGAELLPISDEARAMLGEAGKADERVFIGLKYSTYINDKIRDWARDAGIKKRITFHCSRHTHATLLLASGVDITVVSKMLGHRELKTTQLYAKVMDMAKVEAVKKFPKIVMPKF